MSSDSLQPATKTPLPQMSSLASLPVGAVVKMAALCGVVLALVVYGLLPMLGVKMFASMMSFKKMVMLGGLMVAGVGYWFFIEYTQKKPQTILYGTLLFFPLLTWLTNLGLAYGVNLYKTLWVVTLVCVPSALWVLRDFKTVWQRLPFYKYFAVYLLAATLFYFFNNHIIYDGRFTEGSQPISFHNYFASTFHFLTITLIAVSMVHEKKSHQIFEGINLVSLIIVLVYSIVPLLTYPFKIFTEEVEGMERTRFIFLFTNEYAIYMVLLVLYLLGVYFYKNQLAVPQSKKSQAIYLTAIIFGFLAMLTSFTKLAIGAFIMGAGLMVVFNVQTSAQRKALLLTLLTLPIVGLIGAFVFQAYTDTNIMEGIEARLNNTDSMMWREKVWGYLMDDVNPATFFTGHGYTASNEKMSILEQYSRVTDATANAVQTLHVHNSYISQLYDFGVVGILPMLGLGLLGVFSIWQVFKGRYSMPGVKILDSTIVSLIASYLLFCAFNNMFDMIQTPFWILLTVLYLTRWKLTQQQEVEVLVPADAPFDSK